MDGKNQKSNTGNKKMIFLVSTYLSVILLAASLLYFTARNNDRITLQNQEYLKDNAVQVAKSIESALTEGYANIKMLSNLVSDSLQKPEFDVKSIQEHMVNSVFDFIEFADVNGVDHNITGGVSDASDRQYFLDAKNGNSGMELIYVSRATHETLLMFYSPLYYNDEFVGSLVGAYQASNRLTRLLSTTLFGEKAVSYLATTEGRIIASNQEYDPEQEMYISDLAGGDAVLEEKLGTLLKEKNAASEGDAYIFEVLGNTTGGCIIRLHDDGGYLIQFFPQAASIRMINDSNVLGYRLVAFLTFLFVILLATLIAFYRSQQKEVEEAQKKAETASKAKTSFLFNMSHDIRTPMNAIIGFTDKALRHKDDVVVLNEALGKVKSSSKYLLGIINDILDMAKIESGKLELNEQIHLLQSIRDTIAEVFGAEAARKGLVFHSSYDFEENYVWFDEVRINQILANLMSNAIKYTDTGGEIWYSFEQVPCSRENYGRFVTTVRDTGCGMSQEFLKKIFDAFERDTSAIKSGEQGTGLGMAIVKKLVDALDGTLDIQSEPGKGTTVTFTVELKIASADEVAENNIMKSKVFGKNKADFSEKRILLVEDNEMNREIAVDLLEDRGIYVDTASDGNIAVELIKETAEREDYGYYMAVLMDIQMPTMDGYEATRLIRKFEASFGAHLPIIAMTANAFEEDKQNALAAGMDEHVAKPIDVQKLFEVLAKYVE